MRRLRGEGVNDRTYVDRVRAASDIVAVVGEVVTLKRQGRDYLALCPFHQEKSASFSVSPSKQIFHCFGCGAGGDVFAFVMRYDNLDFPAALEELAKRAGIPPERPPTAADRQVAEERDRLRGVCDLAQRCFRHWLTAGDRRGLAYAQGRGLNEPVIERFGIGYAPPGGDALARALAAKRVAISVAATAGVVAMADGGRAYDRFRDRLTFPIADADGRLVAFGGRALGEAKAKYLNSPETPLFRKGETLFALHLAQPEIRRRDEVVVVEGYMDAVALHAAGFGHAVAVLGTALTRAHVRRLKRYTRRLHLLFDGDAAGVRAAVRCLEVTVNEGVQAVVTVLPPAEDPDSLCRGQGAEAMAACLAVATPLFEFAVGELVKRAGGTDLASRMRALHELVPVARTLNEAAERHLFLSHVADAFRLPLGEVEAALAGSPPAPRRPVPSAAPRGAAEEAAYGVVWFLSEHPESFAFVKAHRVDADLEPGPLRDLLAAVVATERFPADHLASLLHAATPLSDELARRVLEYDHLPDPTATFNDWVRGLRRHRLQREEAVVRHRLKQAEAAAERPQLGDALARLKELREQIAALPHLAWEGGEKK
ncbi:MAG: DNA primase [Nitrospirae bacterium CG18_big_fil_WC_8_21_14_2_50_70_55]|nr:MAG: DNA primase [Nitrospirae bacterium CG18_big_fil_WC_8_21_14_2_50_70_55]